MTCLICGGSALQAPPVCVLCRAWAEKAWNSLNEEQQNALVGLLDVRFGFIEERVP